MEKLLRFTSKKFDLALFVATLTLIGLGISTIQSTVLASSSENAILSTNLVNVQILSVSIGLLLLFILQFINYRYLIFAAVPMYLVAVGLLALILIAGYNSRGSTRWFDLGAVNLQPSTLTAIVLILTLAGYFDLVGEKINNWLTLLGSFLIVMPAFVLVLLEPDLGMALVLASIWFGLLHLAPIKMSRLIPIYIVIALALPLGWVNMADYQQQRVLSFLNPVEDPLGDGYNAWQSVIAVGSGQLTGRGWGQGTQSHLYFLPEQHTDFIFATFAEEQGFMGSVIVLILYGIIIWRSSVIASKTRDMFGQLIVAGVIIWFGIHLFINIGMNIGIAPITGIPLPLMSYGGTAMMVAVVAIGLVESVAVHAHE